VGDRELDASRIFRRDGFSAPDPPLAEQLVVERAAVVAIEAIFVRVIEPLQGKIFSAPRVGAIQERAMISQMRRRHEGIIGAERLPA